MNDPVVIQAQIDAANAQLVQLAALLDMLTKQNEAQVAAVNSRITQLQAQLAKAQEG